MKVLCAYGTRKSKPIVKSGLRKLQYTVTLFDCSHLTLVIVLANAKIHVTVQVFALLDFQFKGNFQVHAPGGLYSRGDLTEGFFALRV